MDPMPHDSFSDEEFIRLARSLHAGKDAWMDAMIKRFESLLDVKNEKCPKGFKNCGGLSR